MQLPININDILTARTIEWERLEFKAGWNPAEAVKVMCAFANDFNNFGGGYVIIGVQEENGRPVLPPKGIPAQDIDDIQRQIIELGHRILPYYYPIVAPCKIGERHLLVLYCPGGQGRPYKAPVSLAKDNKEYGYYIRKGSVTLRAGYQDEVELMSLAANIPYDDRINQQAVVNDLDLGEIREFLQKVKSDLFEQSAKMDFVELCRRMNIIDGPDEMMFPKNVGLMFFCLEPDKFFKQMQIDIVHFPDGPGADNFTEKIFKGPLYKMLSNALDYIKNSVIVEKITKFPDKAESERFYNYPFTAIEEAVCNAVYHRSYEIREPVEVQIHPDKIIITSFPGPDRSIRDNDFKEGRFLSRRYRNRRIGEFLKELDMTEGRGTGIPKMMKVIEANQSPVPIFRCDEERSYFQIELPVKPGFDGFADLSLLEDQNDEKSSVKSSVKGSVKGSVKSREKTTVKGRVIASEKASEKMAVKVAEKTSEKIIESLKKNPEVTIKELSNELNISTRAVEKQVRILRNSGKLTRIGSARNGYWQVID